MKYRAEAPSNIAFIKYMGKGLNNFPTNASLSWTLNHLRSVVELEEVSGLEGRLGDSWEPLQEEGWFDPNLSVKGKDKFLKFFSKLKSDFSISQNFVIRSGNNFPADCGLASSASSFAALTMAFSQLTNKDLKSHLPFWSAVSREGSGSSCRSFFAPWGLWKEEGAEKADLKDFSFLHLAVVVDQTKKMVSSSDAHEKVKSSLLFENRPGRASKRLDQLMMLLTQLQRAESDVKIWQQIYFLVWTEFWDMHALFETSLEPFGYMNEKSFFVLNYCKNIWAQFQDGPVVTMDAGANVHLLFRRDQLSLYKQVVNELKQFQIFESEK